MALQQCGLNLSGTSRELQPHGSTEFPCAGYASRHTQRQEDDIPWHWHDEIELISLAEGQMNVSTPSASFLLEKGRLAAINSGVPHAASAMGECGLRSLVFSPALICGSDDSVFARKYMRPLAACKAFSGVLLEEECVSRWFAAAHDALAQDAPGFEFTVRENLSRICLRLCERFAGQIDERASAMDRDDLRVKKMLGCIHENFADNLSLRDVAGAAGISERECLRCFERTIRLSPFQYLLKYRVMRGAETLLTDPASSVSEAASRCGFDSPSNFARIFKRFYHCTPREYRRANGRRDDALTLPPAPEA